MSAITFNSTVGDVCRRDRALGVRTHEEGAAVAINFARGRLEMMALLLSSKKFGHAESALESAQAEIFLAQKHLADSRQFNDRPGFFAKTK